MAWLGDSWTPMSGSMHSSSEVVQKADLRGTWSGIPLVTLCSPNPASVLVGFEPGADLRYHLRITPTEQREHKSHLYGRMMATPVMDFAN